MRQPRYIVLCAMLVSLVSAAAPEKVVTDFAVSPGLLIAMPLEELRAAESLSIDDLVDKDRTAVLSRIKELPKLTTLKFHGCDLGNMTENDPVPAGVKTVLISGGKISQGTIRWLAKYPSGIELVFQCDVRHLEFDLGKFTWVTFDNCEMSRSAVAKLVERMTQVTFKEVRLTKGD